MSSQNPAFTAIGGGRIAAPAEGLQTTCARPGCTVMFQQTNTPGRPALFCGLDCRRQAHQERRVLRRRLKHHEDQAQYLITLMAAYERSSRDISDDAEDEGSTDLVLSPEVVRAAEDAVVRMQGIARFLKPESGEHASDLLDLFRAVEPVIDYHRRRGGSAH